MASLHSPKLATTPDVTAPDIGDRLKVRKLDRYMEPLGIGRRTHKRGAKSEIFSR